MRKVMVSEKKWIDGRAELVEKGIADFHLFGPMIDGDRELVDTMAFIEWPDGQMDIVDPFYIRFIK